MPDRGSGEESAVLAAVEASREVLRVDPSPLRRDRNDLDRGDRDDGSGCDDGADLHVGQDEDVSWLREFAGCRRPRRRGDLAAATEGGHGHIRPVLVRDWSRSMDGIDATIWASQTTLPPGPDDRLNLAAS
jgi:hypothetical protein